MASLSCPPFFPSLIPTTINSNKTLAFSPPQPTNFLTFKINSKSSSSNSESPPNSEQNPPEPHPSEEDPIKRAFAKARAYKSSTQSQIPPPESVQNPIQVPYASTSGGNGDGPISDEDRKVPLSVQLAFGKAKEYQKGRSGEEDVSKAVQKSGEKSATEMVEKSDVTEAEDEGKGEEVPLAVKLALEKAKEYKENKGNGIGSGGRAGGSEKLGSGLAGGNERGPAAKKPMKNGDKKEELSVSSIDFMGLNFSDKKSGRGLPAGLVPISDSFLEGKLPEVEILVGDTSKFGDAEAASKATPVKEDDADLYKPKVSTWGVFPRPSNISKTYGGGKTIRPGEALESAEERAIKEAQTRQLITAYKSKIGLNIDPKLKYECEKALKDGDALMNLGKLNEALPFYEKVMETLAFQSELHGLAALQWSICQDSLSRAKEARTMYEKLQSHPSPKVSKRARQFFFGFQAMEMMKVSSSSRAPLSTGYQNYFEAFVEDNTIYPLKEAEGVLNQALPYLIFLVSPIFVVLLIAAAKFQ